jgi:hypothetical protein
MKESFDGFQPGVSHVGLPENHSEKFMTTDFKNKTNLKIV